MTKKTNGNCTTSPAGMQEYLPRTADEIYLIKNRIMDVFTKWGYRLVITPTLEYYQNLKLGIGEKQDKKLYKLVDREGNILSLRPEMTAPIARTTARNLDNLDLPARLSYSGSVFRYNESQKGKNREVFQQGIELIGDRKQAEAEVITIAIESILAGGIDDFQIDVGHVGYIEGILDCYGFSLTVKKQIKNYLVKRNLAGLRQYLEGLSGNFNRDFDCDYLERMLLLRGGVDILDRASEMNESPRVRKAVTDLRMVYDFISQYGLGQYINFDLSLLRGFDYYSGIVFEAFATELGYFLCGGGRYDQLIEKYSDKKIPAAGFALGLERIRLVRRKKGVDFDKSRKSEMVIYSPCMREKALKLIKSLHQKGKSAILEERDLDNFKLDQVELRKSYYNNINTVYFLDDTESSSKISVYKLGSVIKREEVSWEELICQN